MENRHIFLEDHRNNVRKGRTAFRPARPVTRLREPIQYVDTSHYLEVTLDTLINWSPHIGQDRETPAGRMGMLDPLRKRRSDLSIRNGVLLYKQIIRPVKDYAFHAWNSTTRTHVVRLQVLQSNCLRLDSFAPCALVDADFLLHTDHNHVTKWLFNQQVILLYFVLFYCTSCYIYVCDFLVALLPCTEECLKLRATGFLTNAA